MLSMRKLELDAVTVLAVLAVLVAAANIALLVLECPL
jgi:hypothetical protein